MGRPGQDEMGRAIEYFYKIAALVILAGVGLVVYFFWH